MSIFSDVINEYIEEKEIKIFALAKYCSTDRSTMYKILNGKRKPPSREMFQKIVQFLHLTPLENQRLEEAWKISRIGPDVYYKRKSVENFITHFPSQSQVSLPGLPFIPVNTDKQISQSDISPLNSQQQINFCMHRMLLSEAGKETGRIGLFLQPDHTFLFSLLSSLQPVGDLNIQHIICFTSKDSFTKEHELYNLLCFREILPLYLAGLNYMPRFFYDNIQSHYFNFNMYPCLVLTSTSALMCSSDYQTGILYRKQNVVDFLWKQYLTYYERSASLFKAASLSPENSCDFFDMLLDTEDTDNTIIIQPEACLTPFFTESLLKSIVNPNLPNQEFLLKQTCRNSFNNLKKIQNRQFTLYFTLDGVLRFARTGLIDEIPEAFYTPLSIEQRLMILQKVLACCQSGAYRLLQKPFRHLPANLRLCIRNEQCSIIFKNNNHQTILFLIQEPSFLDIFHDYLENMNPESFYSPKEAVSLIQKVITCIKKGEL